MKESSKSCVSLIVPCYNEQDNVKAFYEKVNEVFQELPYDLEILYVDDGSKDETLERIKEIADKDDQVNYLAFSRNFGKEAAMYAGFCNVTGDFVAVMDVDLQDPPELLPEMLSLLSEGEYDSVATRRVNRIGEPPIRSFFARAFYRLINRISDIDVVDGARDYRMMKRPMVDAIVAMGERNRFSKGIFGWIGFRTYWMPYENVERVVGETKWSFWKLFQYAVDGIISFSQTPLSVASWSGVLMTIFAFFILLFLVIRRLIFGDPVAGWASTVCIIIFIGGIQLFCLGIIGQYLAKTYVETKQRPHFIVKESNRDDILKIK